MVYRTMMAGLTGALLVLGIAGCQSTYKRTAQTTEEGERTQAARASLVSDAQATIQNFKQTDPSVQQFFDNSYGYAVFPNVGKGGAIVGGSLGEGVVYEQGELAGYTTLTQATIGAQLGGQTFSEIIFFEDEGTFNRFVDRGQRGSWGPTAQASAVALTAGAAGSSDYSSGVAVFVRPRGGLMAEAAVGSQKFDFQPATGGVPATVR